MGVQTNTMSMFFGISFMSVDMFVKQDDFGSFTTGSNVRVIPYKDKLGNFFLIVKAMDPPIKPHPTIAMD